MKIHPSLDLETIKHNIVLYKATKTTIELFLVHRSTQDRVGYSIGFMDVLEGSNDIFCTSYIWADRNKALKKLFELVSDENNLTIRLT